MIPARFARLSVLLRVPTERRDRFLVGNVLSTLTQAVRSGLLGAVWDSVFTLCCKKINVTSKM